MSDVASNTEHCAPQAPSFSVLPVSLRVELAGGIAEPLVLKGTPLPVDRTKRFQAGTAGQRSVVLSFYYGDSSVTKFNRHVGNVELHLLRTKSATPNGVDIHITIDRSCTVDASIVDTANNQASAVTFKSAPLTQQDVTVLQELATTNVREAQLLERQQRTISRAKSLLREAEAAVARSTTPEVLEHAIADLGLGMQDGSVERIEALTDKLHQIVSPGPPPDMVAMFEGIFGPRSQPRARTTASKPNQVISTPAPKVAPAASPASGPEQQSVRIAGPVFIGHGRAGAWRDLKDFLKARLKLDWSEFNSEVSAGKPTVGRLRELLDQAAFAFIVMTAEDEHADGSAHARENVIHELGLFQGRLGFERAIILLEESCSEFSNITGLTQLRFPKGRILAITEEIRRVLEREGILPRS